MTKIIFYLHTGLIQNKTNLIESFDYKESSSTGDHTQSSVCQEQCKPDGLYKNNSLHLNMLSFRLHSENINKNIGHLSLKIFVK